jgi:glycerophosphoryl diester phosphodiesterase
MAPPARLYAHRGAAAELPENTLPAFARALEVGATAIETDCHMTRDGHVVVSHDETGMRMAAVQRAIRESTLDEVRSWDVGIGFVGPRGDRPYAGKDYRIPLLSDLLEACPDVPVNVDAKQPDMAEALVRVVRAARAEARVLIASFDVGTLRRVRALGYEGQTGLAQSEVARLLFLPRRLYARTPVAGAAAQIPHRWRGIDLGTRGVVDRIHARGKVVHYWTVNDVARARALLTAGADGIMTDNPRLLAPLFARFGN